MIVDTVKGALTPRALNSFLLSVGATLAYAQVSPYDLDELREAGFVAESNIGPHGEGLSINGKSLFVDENVRSGTLLALDRDKKVLGILHLTPDATAKSSGDDQDAGDWTRAGDGLSYPDGAAANATPSSPKPEEKGE